MRTRKRVLLIATAMILSPLSPSSRGAEEDWKARLLAEAPKAWGTLKKFSDHLEGAFTVDVKYNDPKLPGQGRTVTQFVIKEGSVRFEIQEGGKKTITAGAFNPNYFFFLQGDPDGAFAVKRIEPTSGREERMQESAASLVLEYVYSPWFFGGEPLARWLQKPGFVVKKVTPQSRGGRTLVRVDFTYAPKEGKGKIPPDRLAFKDPSWCILDPNDYWAMQEYHITAWFGTMHRKVTYGERVDGFPIHKRVEEESVGGHKGRDVKTTTWEINRIARRSASDKEFTMSSFGLPEPRLRGRSVVRNWQWLLGAAVVLAALAFGVRRYLRAKQVSGA